MITTSIQTNNITPYKSSYTKSFNTYAPSFKGSLPCDTVQLSKVSTPETATEILKKFSKFSIDEYKSLSTQELEILRNSYKKLTKKYDNFFDAIGMRRTIDTKKLPFKDIEEKHDKAANYIKKNLDRRYGKGNYTVITIGRSLSSVGKTLGYKIGEENVVNIPLSDADRYIYKKCLERTLEAPNTEFKEFLKNHGLDKETIEKSDRAYILMDYCITGDSLRGARNLLTQDCFMGEKNVRAMDIAYCLPKDFFKNIEPDLSKCRFKPLSFVERGIDLDINKHFVDTSKEKEAKQLVWFKLLDNQMQESLTTDNRKNRKLTKLELTLIERFEDFKEWAKHLFQQ